MSSQEHPAIASGHAPASISSPSAGNAASTTLPIPKVCRLCGDTGAKTVAVRGSDKQLIRCHACTAVFLDPFPEPMAVKEEFEDRHIKSDDRLEYFFGANRDPVLSFVAKRIRKTHQRGAILDVGCAGGRFLAEFFPEAEWQKSGVEPSKFAAARAREKGLHIYQGQLSSVELPETAFDVITAMGVLLYFRDPERDLAKLKRALRPGGLLVVELPLAEAQLWRNSAKISRFVAGKSRTLLGSGHLFYYNVESLDYVLRRAGFTATTAMPVPAMKQRTAVKDFLANGYYQSSRAVWAASGRRLMLGPDFLVFASAK